MATVQTTVGEPSYRRKSFLEAPPLTLSWSSIFGGVVSALGIWALLYAFGLAVGLSAINPDNPESARPSGIFAGIWGLIVPLIALFVGGMVAGRGAGVIHRAGGMIHGLVVWGVTTVAGAFLVGNLLSSALGGVVSVGGGAIRSGAGMIGGARGAGATFDANDALGPVNERLRAEGKPEITAAQLSGVTRDLMSSAVRGERIDREVLVGSIAEQTALSRQDAEEIAGRFEAQWDSTRENLQSGALQVADTTGKAFWGVFGALLFGLIAAVIGGRLGVNRRQQRIAEQGPEVFVQPPPPPSTTYPQQPLHQ